MKLVADAVSHLSPRHAGVSGPRPPRTMFELVGPRSANGLRVIRWSFVETGQELRRDVSALAAGQAESLLEDDVAVDGHRRQRIQPGPRSERGASVIRRCPNDVVRGVAADRPPAQ